MKVEIDQSGKIEQTNLDTIVALSNDIQLAVLLKKKYKRELQAYFREIGKNKIFSYIVFSALIARLLLYYPYSTKVMVDEEYIGHEALIKEYLVIFLTVLKKKQIPPIIFGRVGKHSPADLYAHRIIKGQVKPTKIITTKEIIELVKLL